ncbi:MAG TPA: YXWGXW repeat-containing protein, partial [Candidatus Acidoferrales bacterium]|nr:YXWGXW repeat-containing protein [Candidatus Acidoferrales bacterium]
MTYSFSRPLGWIAKSAALVAALCMLAIPLSASAQLFVGFNIGTPPPPLPYYSQPALSVPGQMWQPGYWGWGPAGYYWVPGTWVTPPSTGTYWTPGYWGYNNGGYAWNNGYWGPSVGYYGGINYGFGYPGTGYVGGMWNNGAFAYNTAVTNVNQRVVRNVYVNRTVVVRHVVNRYSYNGPGGVIARPTAAQLAYARERHIAATRLQVEHARIASEDRSLYASVNRGRPPVTAVARPIE